MLRGMGKNSPLSPSFLAGVLGPGGTSLDDKHDVTRNAQDIVPLGAFTQTEGEGGVFGTCGMGVKRRLPPMRFILPPRAPGGSVFLNLIERKGPINGNSSLSEQVPFGFRLSPPMRPLAGVRPTAVC